MMFEIDNIVKWSDDFKEHVIPKYRDLRWKVTSVDIDTVSLEALSSTDLIRFKTGILQIERDIQYERQLKISKFHKKRKWWNIFKKK